MTRLVLVEPMKLLRGALVALLAAEPDIEVIADLGGDGRLVPHILAARPDVVVVDVDCLPPGGVDALREIHDQLPECRILILATVDKPRDVLRALAVEAHGHLSKDVPPQHLAESIRRVAGGAKVIDMSGTLPPWTPSENPLTRRESEILRLAAEGAPPGEIAYRASLAVGTVRNHLSAAMAKTGARTRVEAIRIADEAGWLADAPIPVMARRRHREHAGRSG